MKIHGLHHTASSVALLAAVLLAHSACPSSSSTPVCGNGLVEEDEMCDHGEENVDGVYGPADGCQQELCVPTAEWCGDGMVQAQEECEPELNEHCSPSCTLMPSCGDGQLDDGEACDPGNNPVSYGPEGCTVNCQLAPFCGDQVMSSEHGEACDPGNNPVSYGPGCTTNCTVAPKCGDGTVDTDHGEICDGPIETDADGCSDDCKATTARVFLSSVLYKGGLGGVAGANAKCQLLAEQAGIAIEGRPFLAWVDNADAMNQQPVDRFEHYAGDYVRVDGKLIAEGWTELTSGTLRVPIIVSEAGEDLSADENTTVWTGVSADGTNTGQYSCVEWTSNALGDAGSFGDATATNASWSFAEGSPCLFGNRLYCFEQVAE